ncbi:hypothetical protein [Symmachiella dynata]|uniref:hypothetical protein n=1 Tax=Symmachiella dynata TaxID=2527995 RepID=UPI0030EF07DD
MQLRWHFAIPRRTIGWLPDERKAVEDYHARQLEQAQRWQETLTAVAVANQQIRQLREKAEELLQKEELFEAIAAYEELTKLQLSPADNKVLYSLYARTMQWDKAVDTGLRTPESFYVRDQTALLYGSGRNEEYLKARQQLLADYQTLNQPWQFSGHLMMSSLLPVESELHPAIRHLADGCSTSPEPYEKAMVGKAMYRLGVFETWYENLEDDSPLKAGQDFLVQITQFKNNPTEENREKLLQAIERQKESADKQITDGALGKYWWGYIERMAWVREGERVLNSGESPP